MAGADPLIRVEDIRAIKRLLRATPKEYALFVIGIATNLRASDLCRLKVGQVRYLSVGHPVPMVEKKTRKHRRITANEDFVEAVQMLIQSRLEKNPNLSDEEFLFVGQRGPMIPSTVQKFVVKWTKMIHLDEKTSDFGRKPRYSAHTLRKTFGWHAYSRLGIPLPELVVMFNHATQAQTLEYLSIQDKKIEENYLKMRY